MKRSSFGASLGAAATMLPLVPSRAIAANMRRAIFEQPAAALSPAISYSFNSVAESTYAMSYFTASYNGRSTGEVVYSALPRVPTVC